MTVLIAEKPSVGRELAKAVNAKENRNGYITGGTLNGDTCCVTWAIGHLVEISAQTPSEWSRLTVPVIPERFTLDAIKERKIQLETIKRLVSGCDLVVNCGDAGREGELIQRYILQWCGYKGPVMRLWISSLTDEAIAKGLKNLRPGHQYDPLFHAGRARNEADWLVGMNATMALTASAREKGSISKGVLSLGRVQTPTLAMVCSRYAENKNFVPEDFWRIRLHTSAHGVKFEVLSETKFKDQGKAESGKRRAEVGLLEVIKTENERRNIAPPLLHDLTSLQKAANSRYNMSADTTLKAAQNLYEKKLLTYPRTGSKYISEDVFRTIGRRLRRLESDPRLGERAIELAQSGLNRRCVNDSKVTDHHALLIEDTPLNGMNDDERNIYILVAERMLEAFSQPAIEDVMKVTCKAADMLFTASGTTVISPGWKQIRKQDQAKEKQADESEDKNQMLPNLKEGNKLEIHKAETVRGTTRPKPLHTEASLLAAMESAGKDLEDKDLKEAMKESGLGTPATRAGIIETLKRRKYIELHDKHLVPTATGNAVWKMTSGMLISDVSMTGQWEQKLEDIASFRYTETEFGQEIRRYARLVTEQIFGSEMPVPQQTDEQTTATCPSCGGKVLIKDSFAKCQTKECGLFMNRTVCGKRIGTKTVVKLLEGKTTGIVKGLKGKTGKEFEARLKLEINEKEGRLFGNIRLVFDSPDTRKAKRYGTSSKSKK